MSESAAHRADGRPIDDYALIADTETAALVSRDGSIDWLCLPRFDSAACFTALLGTGDHGFWRLAPREEPLAVRRRYRPGTLVLETEYETSGGAVRVVDCMPLRDDASLGEPDVVRVVEGVEGEVAVDLDLAVRFDYGSVVPRLRQEGQRLEAIGGPDAVVLATPVELRHGDRQVTASFTVQAGEQLPFVLTWFPSHEPAPDAVDAEAAIDRTARWWRDWLGACTYEGPWRDAVERSLITLKALTYRPSGGIVAAATTSLPEDPGGERNWDYRYVWLRDATFTLQALLRSGFRDEAVAWRDWLLRAVAGDPADLQIMYGIHGRRRLTEIELDWLPGHAGARPVREGNAAHAQRQTDVYGEVMDSLHVARRRGIEPDREAWDLQRSLLDWLAAHWHEPDNGLWEIRGQPRHFTHSRVMAWVAFDRAVQASDGFGLDGPRQRWATVRDEIRDEILREGFDRERNTFTQSYGSRNVDASLLMIPLVGFLPGDDPRVLGTIDAIERDLVVDGLVRRYDTRETRDGLRGGEGMFLLTSFWLVDALAMAGRVEEATRRFERLLDLRNDVGLLAEEFDLATGQMLGNMPQAFSHVALVSSAWHLQAISEDRRPPTAPRGHERASRSDAEE